FLEPQPLVSSGKVRVVARAERGPFPAPPEVYSLSHAGEPLPFFRRYDLAVRLGADETEVVDRPDGRWMERRSVPGSAFRRVVTSPGVAGRVKFSYQSLAHLVVLPLGHRVLGI